MRVLSTRWGWGGERVELRFGRRPRIVDALLFVGFVSLYAVIGVAFERTGVLRLDDALFQADAARVALDLTDAAAHHDRTIFHPLVAVLLGTPGRLLAWGLGSQVAAALTMVASAGATTVVLVRRTLAHMGAGLGTSLLLACVLGFSTTQLVLSAVPETFAFTALGLALCCWCSARPTTPTWVVLAASAFTVGMLVTTAIPVAALYVFGLPRSQRLRDGGRFAAIIGAVLVAGVIATWLLSPSAEVHLSPDWVRDQAAYGWIPTTFRGVVGRTGLDGLHLTVYNIVAPRPATYFNASSGPSVTFQTRVGSWFTPLGWIAVALLVTTYAAAVTSLAKRRTWRNPVVSASLLGLAAAAALHFAWGDDLFLYSGAWTVLLVVTVGAGFIDGEPLSRVSARPAALLVPLVVLQASNNLGVLNTVVAWFAEHL